MLKIYVLDIKILSFIYSNVRILIKKDIDYLVNTFFIDFNSKDDSQESYPRLNYLNS